MRSPAVFYIVRGWTINIADGMDIVAAVTKESERYTSSIYLLGCISVVAHDSFLEP